MTAPSVGSPSPVTSTAAEPPPPATFDPDDVPVFSYVGEDGTVGVWLGSIGRPDLAVPLVAPIPETEGGYDAAKPFGEGRAVAAFTDATGRGTVRLLEAGRPAIDLLDRALPGTVAAAPAAGVIAAARLTDDGADDGVWVARTSEPGAPEPVLAPEREALDRGAVALSPDGRSVAAATCARDLDARFAGGDVRSVPAGLPLGFDPRGRLIAHDDCGGATVRAWEPDATIGDPLTPDGIGFRGIVTQTGRTLAVVSGEAIPGVLLVRSLDAGREIRLPLAEGAWDVTTDSTDRYIVLRRDDGQGERFAWTWAVADVEEGWVGYLPVDALPDG